MSILATRSLPACTAMESSIGLTWRRPQGEDSRAPVTSYQVRYREVGASSWLYVTPPHDSSGSFVNATITGLQNRRHYEVHVAAVNRVGTGPWASGEATTQPAPVDVPDDGSPALGVPGHPGAYWTDSAGSTTPHPDSVGNTLRLASCSGELSFRVFWSLPEGRSHADEWEAYIRTTGRAGTVIYTLQPASDPNPEMSATVDMAGPGNIAISVRGRFGPQWGTWSNSVRLSCNER